MKNTLVLQPFKWSIPFSSPPLNSPVCYYLPWAVSRKLDTGLQQASSYILKRDEQSLSWTFWLSWMQPSMQPEFLSLGTEYNRFSSRYWSTALDIRTSERWWQPFNDSSQLTFDCIIWIRAVYWINVQHNPTWWKKTIYNGLILLAGLCDLTASTHWIEWYTRCISRVCQLFQNRHSDGHKKVLVRAFPKKFFWPSSQKVIGFFSTKKPFKIFSFLSCLG